MNKDGFSLYRGVWVNDDLRNVQPISRSSIKEFLRRGGWAVRNTYDFDCQEVTGFWYIIKDHFGGIEELSKSTRNCVRRALNTLIIKKVEAATLQTDEAYDVYLKSFQHYKVKTATYLSKSAFFELFSAQNYHFWAIFVKETQQLVGFSINEYVGDFCYYRTIKVAPEFLKFYYPFYGLFFEMNRYYLQELGVQFVCDGARSITNHSNIQPFLEEKFKFRKAYCRLQISYKWYISLIIRVLYPFRKIIPIPQIKAVLNMEAMKRNQI